jgi:5'-3' exonuclease
MGIPSYFSFLVKSHRNIIKKINKDKKIHNLYLDSNSIIYDSIKKIDYNYKSNNEEFEINLIKEVCHKINEYINIIKPSNKVFIAFDGVAPVAKLEQQRNRRYKSWFQNELNKAIKPDINVNDSWDTCSITPGTKFMDKLGIYIKHYFKNVSKFGVKEIIVSCSNDAGEGEHKIYKYIRDHKEYHSNTETIIYGLDADLIMLTLNHLYICNKLYLFRETPHFIKNIDNTLDPDELYVMDIPALSDAIFLEMKPLELNNKNMFINHSNSLFFSSEHKKNIIFDYILICFILGNDFLPHFPSINIRTNGIHILMNAYKDAFLRDSNKIQYLTNDNKIIWKNLRLFISKLAQQEEENFINEMKIRDKQEKNNGFRMKTMEDRLLNIPMLDRNVEKYINPQEEGWQTRYYKKLFDIDIDDIRREQICINYLEGLEWTIQYYTTGCKDWRWKYNYNYPPLLKDLIKYIPYFESEFIKDNSETQTSIHKHVQLSYVLPKNSLYLLPEDIQSKLLKNYSHYYGSDYKIIWAFCKYFWESHVIMPEIDIEKLESLVN